MKKLVTLMMLVAMVGLVASSAQAAAVLTVNPTYTLPDDANRISRGEWNTNGVGELWYLAKHKSYSVSGGLFSFTVEDTYTGGPYVWRYEETENNTMALDTTTYKYVEFRLRIESDATDVVKFCYRTNANNDPHYFRALPTGHDGKGFVVYQFDMTADLNWTDDIIKVRLDLGNNPGKTFDLDYFRLSSTPEPATMTLLLLGLPFALRRRR